MSLAFSGILDEPMDPKFATSNPGDSGGDVSNVIILRFVLSYLMKIIGRRVRRKNFLQPMFHPSQFFVATNLKKKKSRQCIQIDVD